MVEYEKALVRGAAALDGGTSVIDALRATPARQERMATQEALNRLATARHHFRLLLIAACVDDGMNAERCPNCGDSPVSGPSSSSRRREAMKAPDVERPTGRRD